MSDLSFHKIPVKIDGVSQETSIQEAAFRPEGVLEFQYQPLETVLINEKGNDLLYFTSYWEVERNWRIFLNKNVYDRLLSKFLQQREVVLDYTNPKKPKVFLPRDGKVEGFQSMYRGVVNDLRSMNGEELEQHLADLGYDPLWSAADKYVGR